MAPRAVAIESLIDQLAARPSRQAMTAFLRRHETLRDAAIVEQLYERVVRVARADLRRAWRLAEAAAWLAEKLDDDGCRAQSLRAMGHVLLIRGRYSQALERYDAALQLFHMVGRDVDVGRTLSGGALQALIALGRFDEALASAKRARAVFEQHGDTLRLARLDSNMGNILQRQNRLRDALALYRRAHAELTRIGTPSDIAAVLINMAVCLTTLNDFTAAVETYQSARAYCDANGMQLLVVQADYNIAYLHFLRGEYARALHLYRVAQEGADRAGDLHHRALCDLDRSEIYLELNVSEEAEQLADRALASFERLGLGYEMGKALTNLALAASHGRRTDRAMKQFRRARALFAREGNQVRIALVDFYQACILHRDGRQSEARALCLSARDLFTQAAVPAKAAMVDLLLARVELDSRCLHEAEHACQRVLAKLSELESPMLSYQANFTVGLIREARGDRRGAYAAFENARRDLESLRGHLQAEDLKIAFLKDKLAVYESLVSLCLELGTDDAAKEAAFAYIEQAKSRSLLDLIALPAATLTSRANAASGERVRRLREQVNWNDRQIELEETRGPGRSAARIEQLRRRMRVLESELSQSLDVARAADEDFALLSGAPLVGLDGIRAALAPDTMLLEYYEARGRLYACTVGRERLDVVALGSAAPVKDLARLLQFQLSRFRLRAQYAQASGARMHDATLSHLAELYTELVAPVRHRLDATHLVVVPHGFLHGLPFHALVDGGRALVDEFTISYAPSAAVARTCALKRPEGTGALVMGVPDERAPQIADEVRSVADLLPDARVLMGEEATAERLRIDGAASRFVHIVTHGHFRTDNPMLSSIQLGSGPLSVFDLYQFRLSAELVTLSGCSTGLNTVVSGDELKGLVRGLLHAGASNVLLTLWDVNDESTTDFMKGFYRHLRAGAGKASALRMGMRELRERYPHPFYWAPFVLVGQ